VSTPHGPIRREQGLRGSGAAGPHDKRNPRKREVDAAVAEQLEDVWIDPANDEAWGGAVDVVPTREEYEQRRASGAPTISEETGDA